MSVIFFKYLVGYSTIITPLLSQMTTVKLLISSSSLSLGDTSMAYLTKL